MGTQTCRNSHIHVKINTFPAFKVLSLEDTADFKTDSFQFYLSVVPPFSLSLALFITHFSLSSSTPDIVYFRLFIMCLCSAFGLECNVTEDKGYEFFIRVVCLVGDNEHIAQ